MSNTGCFLSRNTFLPPLPPPYPQTSSLPSSVHTQVPHTFICTYMTTVHDKHALSLSYTQKLKLAKLKLAKHAVSVHCSWNNFWSSIGGRLYDPHNYNNNTQKLKLAKQAVICTLFLKSFLNPALGRGRGGDMTLTTIITHRSSNSQNMQLSVHCS